MSSADWISANVHAPLFSDAHWISAVSLVLIVIGLAIRWTAIATLGRAFSANVAIRNSQQLKQTGLYRFVRHPSYTGLLLVLLAVGVRSHNWVTLLIVVTPFLAALTYRIHLEETMLRRAFGEEYLAYSRRTPRLVPGIY